MSWGMCENYCETCDLADKCELAYGIMFCDNCKDSCDCSIKFATCEAGHFIECNNGWEDKEDYCCEDEDDDKEEPDENLSYLFDKDNFV